MLGVPAGAVAKTRRNNGITLVLRTLSNEITLHVPDIA
jgi:hypothetical protein